VFRRFLPAVLALLCASCEAGGPSPVPVPIAVKVVGITDGDTVTAILNGKQIKVRLNGIDAPEKGQPFGNAAKEELSRQVFGKTATMLDRGKDRWGRTIAELWVNDRRITLAMVDKGLAWHFVKYAPDDVTLARLEAKARQAKRGLWVE